MVHIKSDIDDFQFDQKIESTLAQKLCLSELRNGCQVIRNENGWRENEKDIEYIWVLSIARSFVGWGGLFSIKFKENKFREHLNSEELVQGIFLTDNECLKDVYVETMQNTSDKIAEMLRFNLFEANPGIPLDGVSYRLHIIANNIDTRINLNNPNTNEWRKWEEEVWSLGKQLALKSKVLEMIQLFN